jgi:DNA-binding transcriptional LysR family regulator
MTLKQLKIFVLTYKYGSLSKAADSFFLSQPAASMSLRQLEQIIAAPLFDRVGKNLVINSIGNLLLPKAIAIIDQADELETLSLDSLSCLQGNLRVGCTLTVGNYLLPIYLANFKKRHPNISFNICINNTSTIIDKINSFDLDIALIEGAESKGKNLVYKKWANDDMVMISHSRHPLVNKEEIIYSDLELYPWVSREVGSGTADLIEKQSFNKFKINNEIILTDFESIKNYVANSNCLSCISISAMQGVSGEKLKILNTPFNFKRSISMVTNKLKYESIISKKFKESLFNIAIL